jgi:hypothetical protein
MTNELTIFKNGGAPSTVFKGVDLPKTRLGDGIEGGMPWKRISYRAKDWAVRDGSVSDPLMRIVDGQREKNPNLDVVILKAANHPTRRWYAKGYEENDAAPPDCYSTRGFKPDDGSTMKQDEGKGCLNCRWSAFGSKEGSKGKACSEYKTLAVVPVGDILNTINRGPMQLQVPPNSLKALKNYDALLAANGAHYAQVWTRITFAEGLFEFDFDAKGFLDDVQAAQAVKALQNPMVDRILDEEIVMMAGDSEGSARSDVGTVHKLKDISEPAPAEPRATPGVQAQPEKEKPAPAPAETSKTTDITDAPKLTPAEQEIADLKAKLAAMEKDAADKPKRGRPRQNGPRTPQVAPTNMDSAALAGPPLPAPVGPAPEQDLQAPGKDPALDAINATLNRAKVLI